MRTNIVHIGAGELTYEIRNIVNVGMKLEKLGLNYPKVDPAERETFDRMRELLESEK